MAVWPDPVPSDMAGSSHTVLGKKQPSRRTILLLPFPCAWPSQVCQRVGASMWPLPDVLVQATTLQPDLEILLCCPVHFTFETAKRGCPHPQRLAPEVVCGGALWVYKQVG